MASRDLSPSTGAGARGQPQSGAQTNGRYLDPIKEAKAVAALRESLRQMGEEGDETLLLDSIEGENSLLEAVDKLLVNIAEAEGLAKGAEAAAQEISHRAERFVKRAESCRALLEQALMV